ncbi:GlcNAc-PI de-N-acetylase [Methylobacterium sp. Leaf104]|uniref:PIG-L deacetylase family protein n=1 Tax=Methylobacterium TaxID=407 RepID=UPI0006FA0897|nr:MULTISPECIES: PIG-L family deacetylase [Methylobacterium]KQP42628.1 GlcNAc-PI de-N-acetylase [Methylobacterium sp. Leaf104]MCI9878810.1 PIG-L family deacetylase [Methylobacterium goesingense]
MPTALALSPHLDDAAFSCGGFLHALGAAGWDVATVTVFTGSVANPTGFALACQTDKGLGPELDYMDLRRSEDAAAIRALGLAPPRHLPFREAPHRGYASAAELFRDVRADDGIVPDLTGAFRALLSETAPDLILAPQAIGGHVDHVQVVRALDAAGPTAPILWWRDFPYTVRDQSPKEPLRARFADLPEAEICCGPEGRAAKAVACAAYATQLGFQFGGPEGLARRLAQEGGVERFRRQGSLPDNLGRLFADAG